MAKRPQTLGFVAEGRFEGFAPVRRDFKLTLENESSFTITGGVIAAQWVDPNKPAEKWIPERGSTNHVFSPGPNAIVVYVECEDGYWGGVANVEGYSTLTVNLYEKA